MKPTIAGSLRLHEPQPAGRHADESLWIPRWASPSRSSRGCGGILPNLDPALISHAGQGVILWGHGVTIPWRHVSAGLRHLPPEVARNGRSWPGSSRSGLELGVTTRPADLALRLDWKQDQVIPSTRMIRPSEMLGGVFRDDRPWLHPFLPRQLRRRPGARQADAVSAPADGRDDPLLRRAPMRRHLALLGRISETTFTPAARAGHSTGLVGTENWRIYQWLVPGCQLVSRLYQVEARCPRLRVGGPILLSPTNHATGAGVGFSAGVGAQGHSADLYRCRGEVEGPSRASTMNESTTAFPRGAVLACPYFG